MKDESQCFQDVWLRKGVPFSGYLSMNHVVNIDNINLPNVTNAKEFSKELLRIYQKDMDFERLVKSMTTDRLAGGGRLGKHRIVI